MSEYTCARCRKTYEETWGDEEAVAEYATNFPERAGDPDVDIVCDDCYKAFMEWFEDKPRVPFAVVPEPTGEVKE